MSNWPVPWPRGHDLVLVARSRDRLDALARGLRGHGVQVHAVDCDVTEPGAGVFLAAAVAERALEVSVLCDNAGAAYGSRSPHCALA